MLKTSTPDRITLTPAQALPLDRLVASDANVRRIKAGLSLDQLAEDIGRRGLLQSLNVRPMLDETGAETGRYAVTAGGRRLAALKILVKAKRLPKNAPVPCIVKADGPAQEDSLAENTMREALHPLDQFRAFQTLRDEHGMGEEAIAARFFVMPAVVRQRLKLAAVSPALLDLYAEDQISLEQVMAFTITDDHARQEQVWETMSRSYAKEPYLIRRMLTEGKVQVTDRRAMFVGAEAYAAAGGAIARDLFQQDHGGWFEDVALLERLVDERLKEEAAPVIAQGWKWVEVARDFPYGHTFGLRRVPPTVDPLADDEESRLTALREEMARIEREHSETGEDLPEEVDQRLADLEGEIEALEERPGTYEPEDVAIGGAFVSIGHDGRIRIEGGYIRPEDEPAAGGLEQVDGEAPSPVVGAVPVHGNGIAHVNGSEPPAEEDDGGASKPLSERLITELSAHRTLALRQALANDPDVALVAVLHALVLRAFYGQQGYDPASCLEIEARSSGFSGIGVDGAGLGETSAAQALAQMHEAWAAQLPKRPGELWDWLLDLDGDTRASLLAYCAARSLNATHQPYDRRFAAMAHATQLAGAVGLDMAEHWSPTVASYLGRVTKGQILSAVAEAKGAAAAQMIDHLKKGDMAEEAERLLAGTGWLPPLLRTPAGAPDDDEPAGTEEPQPDAASSDSTLPAFLRGEAEEAYGVAAE